MSVIGGTPRQLPPGQVDERFGALHQQQIDDEIKIVGVNTLGHHIGSDLKPGAGLPDQAALDALQPPIPPQVPESAVRRQRFERQLIALDQFADNYERTLIELRAIDPHHFDTHFGHLYRTNLPRSTPDPSIGAGTTFQAALMKVGVQAQPSKVKSMSLEEAQALNKANQAMFAAARAPAAPRVKPALPDAAPQPWKESK